MTGRVILLLAALAVPAWSGLRPPPARAEAPFFYDSIAEIAVVDTAFQPTRREAGGFAVEVQAWSLPEAPGQSLGRQEVTGQYRLHWSYPLDPRYDLRVELKADTQNEVIDEDYFLRGEFFYKGAHVPLWFYAGVRLPEKANVGGYIGLETPSHRLGELLPLDPPVGFRGFGEVRLSQDEQHPTVRFTGLVHSLPARGRPSLTAAVVFDSFFQEEAAPRWIVEGHLELSLGRKLLKLVMTGGYEVEPVTGDQRASLGVRRGLF